jgi:hypothetical protein
MRRAVRLVLPLALVVALAALWRLPWDHYVLSVAVVATVLSAARGLHELRRPTRRAAEMSKQESIATKQRSLWGGLVVLGLGLGLCWLCRRLLPPIPPGIRLPGTVLDFYVDTAGGFVVLAYVAIAAIYVGFAALVRLADLATDDAG